MNDNYTEQYICSSLGAIQALLEQLCQDMSYIREQLELAVEKDKEERGE